MIARMKTLLASTMLLAAITFGGKMQTPDAKPSSPVTKVTPMLYVDRIEPSLKLWVGRLGYTKVAEVPEGDHLGFVMLINGPTEVMLQTRSGVRADNAAVLPYIEHPSAHIYIEVSDFPDLLKRVEGYEVFAPMRDTFYGMREITIKDPAGNLLVFAAPIKK
jgi:catechol 2,3-dioxygenase-like lactoylglutathione lyase family enzyme